MRQSLVLPTIRAGAIMRWLATLACVAVLVYVLVGVAGQIIFAPSALRLIVVRDIPLPSGLGAISAGAHDPLAPGVDVPFDRFDFQAYDPQTHKLFIAHTGPNSNKLTAAHIPFDADTDGQVLVFDTQSQRLIGRVNIPHVAGVAVAGGLHKVFVSDADDNVVYAIDENTLEYTPIKVGDNERPDAISYDPRDQRIFVSDPGMPTGLNNSSSIDRRNQNLVVIDARKDKVITKINLGSLPKLPAEKAPTLSDSEIPPFGYAVGHNEYDDTQHRVFVTTQILPDATTGKPPPAGTGELIEINPVTAKVVQRVILPATCITPHGLALDTTQEVAFIACVDIDLAHGIAQNLARVDLKAMRVIPANPQAMRLAPMPDIVLVDHAAQVVLVGCRGGITIFDERAGAFKKLGDYQIGKNTHSIALDEATQYIYVPITVGGRPVLRVTRYNPSGV